MKTISFNKEKAIAGTVAAVFLFSILGTAYYYRTNKSLEQDLNTERLASEKLLSEKLLLAKELDQFKQQLGLLTGKNAEMDKLVHNVKSKLAEKEQYINRLLKDNASVTALRKQLADIKKLKINLESDIASMNDLVSDLRAQNRQLSDQLADSKVEVASLAQNIEILSAMAADNFRVEALRGRSEKLTINAKRAKKMNVSFEVPETVVTNIHFKIKTPEGQVLSSTENSQISINVLDTEAELQEEQYLASLTLVDNEIQVTKRIEMCYTPESKLSKGIYKIEILNNEHYLGSCQVKLK